MKRRRTELSFVMIIIMIVIWYLLDKRAVHATEGVQPAVQRERIITFHPNAIVTRTAGLTSHGCSLFFPHVPGLNCLEQWRSKTLEQKLQYLMSDGSLMMRSDWEYVRQQMILPQAREQLRAILPGLPLEAINLFLNNSSLENITSCSRDSHQDYCLLTVGKIFDGTVLISPLHAP